MSDTPSGTPSKKKPHPAVFIGVIVLILVILGFAIFVSKQDQSAKLAEQTVIDVEQNNPVTSDQVDATATTSPAALPTEAPVATSAPVKIDVNAALSDRILGDASAPIKLSEHSSLTCPHCADFHRETFGKIKKEYIDTGKVHLVFSDFPLNEPALRATMVARCLPEDKYFDFIQMLFEKQADWAGSSTYQDFLKEEAGKAGLDAAHFDACINNKEIEDGVLNRMKGIQAQWNINSTPSFVVNNRSTVSGAIPFEEFKTMIDNELKAVQAAAKPPVPAEEKAAPVKEEPKAQEAAPAVTSPPTPTAPEATTPTEPEASGTATTPAQ